MDQKEEGSEEGVIRFENSDLTKKMLKQDYLNFYYFVVYNKNQVKRSMKMLSNNIKINEKTVYN